MKPSQLKSNEYGDYYGKYIGEAPDLDINEVLEKGGENIVEFIKSIPEDKFEFSYSQGKWTVKEVIQHLIDTERIFSYRAFHFARGDKSPLPGFAQNNYVSASDANRKDIEKLIAEYRALRIATTSLFESFNDKMLLGKGILNKTPMTARAAGFVIVGHEIYHRRIIEERYL